MGNTLSPTEQAQGSGLLVRGFRAGLEELGKLEAVRARLPEDAARVLAEPPLPMAWVSLEWFIHVAQATHAEAGPQGCRLLGRTSARASSGGVLAPLIKTSLTLFGASPPTLYKRLDTFCTVLVRHAGFSFQPAGPRAGTLRVHYRDAVPAPLFATWEGVCQSVHALCGVTPDVSPAHLEEGGRVGRIEVRW